MAAYPNLVNKENISNSFATSCMFDLACVWIGSRGWHRSVSWIVKDLKSAGSLVKMPRGGHLFIPNHVCQFDKQIKLERKLFKLQFVQVARIYEKHKISSMKKLWGSNSQTKLKGKYCDRYIRVPARVNEQTNATEPRTMVKRSPPSLSAHHAFYTARLTAMWGRHACREKKKLCYL